MATEPKSRSPQDSFLDVLHSETIAGTENLSAWISHVSNNKGIETLFELEAWLKGLQAFFDVRHLPLSEAERSNIVNRSFAPEIRIARHVLQLCERRTSDILRLGQPQSMEFEAFVESQMRKDSVLDYHVSKILEQPAPPDSLARLLEALTDIRVLIDSVDDPVHQSYQLFLSVGRTFQRALKDCRYIDMLLTQRFKLQFDRVDNTVLTGVLRGIPEEHVRRNVSLGLLHLYRLLRYLKLLSRDLAKDRPLRHSLVIFSLLHEEMECLSGFLKSRLLKGREVDHSLVNAADLIVYSLKMESQRALERELIFLSREREAPSIYAKIENSHGLLRNCYQSCILTLVHAFDKDFDGRTIFPSMVDSLQSAQELRQELWDLRQYMKRVLESREEFDLDQILDRLAAFRESSLRNLMYRDWGEFEQFADSLVTAGNRIELRTLLRKFISFLETLVQEVSKRSIFQATSTGS